MGGSHRGGGGTAGPAPFMAPSIRLVLLFFFSSTLCSFQAAARSCEGLSPAKVEEYPFASPGVTGRSRPISSVLHSH